MRASVVDDPQAEQVGAGHQSRPDQKDKLRGMLEEKWTKMDALDKEYRAKMRDVLTPAQQTEWDKIKSEYRAKMQKAK